MINQLTLGVSLKDDATFLNYGTGQNGFLIQALKQASQGLGERIIYFHGAGGAGATHLLQAACHEANRYQRSVAYIPLSHLIEYSETIFEGLEALDLVCVDDLHLIAGKPQWEEAFFHAYNRIYDADSQLILTAKALPKSLGLKLPDLESRLSWGVVCQLQSLSDDEKLEVLMMRAGRRGMTLSEEVGKFILNHCPRHMATLFAAFEALDKATLAHQRKLTIPFVKAILQI